MLPKIYLGILYSDFKDPTETFKSRSNLWIALRSDGRYCLGRGQCMKHSPQHRSFILVMLVVATSATAQEKAAILAGAELQRVALTLMRSSAAARFDTDRYVICGLVDTSAYSADVRANYVGFLIADAPITLNGKSLRCPHPLIMAADSSWWCAAVQRQRLLSQRCAVTQR